ncbi:hypothetical protein GCM10009632_33690 [Mycolicibacterium alvei]|jgi:hypothetical protein|uniref:Uncharacterized protein n=1 Tax=Mycolicibacterium alvei TaxID=67081 RepID=A0A6N4UL81_9MYCO|nr:hypothetical protein MALV_10110 [Mycolicibacterium alvei]
MTWGPVTPARYASNVRPDDGDRGIVTGSNADRHVEVMLGLEHHADMTVESGPTRSEGSSRLGSNEHSTGEDWTPAHQAMQDKRTVNVETPPTQPVAARSSRELM